MMVTGIGKESSLFDLAYKKINAIILSRFSGYVLLTEDMNDIINPNNKPYIIMEGLVDSNMNRSINDLEDKAKVRIIIYGRRFIRRIWCKYIS